MCLTNKATRTNPNYMQPCDVEGTCHRPERSISLVFQLRTHRYSADRACSGFIYGNNAFNNHYGVCSATCDPSCEHFGRIHHQHSGTNFPSSSHGPILNSLALEYLQLASYTYLERCRRATKAAERVFEASERAKRHKQSGRVREMGET